MEAYSVVRQIWFGEDLPRQIRSVNHHRCSLYVCSPEPKAVAWISLDADRIEALQT